MHRQLLDLLHKATGKSCHVIAVFLDIRGFTSFSGANESTDAAAFLRVMYSRIIDEYFPDPLFFKPTGDGLMIILHHSQNDDDFRDSMAGALTAAVRLVEEFPKIADADIMVNFEVPTELGIGIARGSVTQLGSGDFTIDYSGRSLNLAARLMDLARPRGVVFHDKFARALVPDELGDQFDDAQVYVKGVAESEPLPVVFTAGMTELPPLSLKPIAMPEWRFDDNKMVRTMREIRDMGDELLSVSMSESPLDGEVLFYMSLPMSGRRGHSGSPLTTYVELPGEVRLGADGPRIAAKASAIMRSLVSAKVKLDTKITLQAKYRV